jgi:hypothetical protein
LEPECNEVDERAISKKELEVTMPSQKYYNTFGKVREDLSKQPRISAACLIAVALFFGDGELHMANYLIASGSYPIKLSANELTNSPNWPIRW